MCSDVKRAKRGYLLPAVNECPGAVAVYKGLSVGVSLGGLSVFLHGGGLGVQSWKMR